MLLCAILTPSVAGDITGWNWIAEYVFDANGNVTSFGLTTGAYWVDCSTSPWALVASTHVPTTNETVHERDRLNTSAFVYETLRQEGGWQTTTTYACVGTEIEVPDPLETGDHECTPFGVIPGSNCSFNCGEGDPGIVFSRVDIGTPGTTVHGFCNTPYEPSGRVLATCRTYVGYQCHDQAEGHTVQHNHGACGFVGGIGIQVKCGWRLP